LDPLLQENYYREQEEESLEIGMMVGETKRRKKGLGNSSNDPAKGRGDLRDASTSPANDRSFSENKVKGPSGLADMVPLSLGWIHLGSPKTMK
jgi:hypothetical protein